MGDFGEIVVVDRDVFLVTCEQASDRMGAQGGGIWSQNEGCDSMTDNGPTFVSETRVF